MDAVHPRRIPTSLHRATVFMTPRPRRLISIAHSYCVALNRRLAHEMAQVGAGEWEVTAVAPSFFHGDLRPIPLETQPGELCRLEAVPAHFTKHIHVMLYGRRLREILCQTWDLVHSWEEPYILAGGQVAWWAPPRLPLVFWTAQNISKRYPPPFAQLEEYCLDRCVGWMACGQSVVETLLPRGYSHKPYRVMPLGVDLNHFHPNPSMKTQIRQRLGWVEPGPPVIGYLGRFVAEKGLILLTDVLDRTPSSWRALFVGRGPLEKRLREWAAGHGDRVQVVTDVKHDQAPAYLNAMDILCAPSQTTPRWREQLGRMLIEAFACGVPVVASDSGEIPYVVTDAGVVVGEKDELGWARALINLLEDPSQRAELSARGIERARRVYSWPIIARQHLDFFNELLDSPGNGRR